MILIIEDDPQQSEIARTLLRHYGFDAVVAASAERGLEIARTREVSLALVDVHLLGMNGWEASRIMKTDPATSHIPLIVTSLYDIDRRMIAASGCDLFLPKPWHVDALIGAVRKLVAEGRRPEPEG
ncbi:MAG: response regulator [Longimicrobiales bacterium]